jgi:hypothetical protein
MNISESPENYHSSQKNIDNFLKCNISSLIDDLKKEKNDIISALEKYLLFITSGKLDQQSIDTLIKFYGTGKLPHICSVDQHYIYQK